MRKLAPCAFAVVLTVVVAASAAAQAQNSSKQPQSTFKAASRLVTVNVVVDEKDKCSFFGGCRDGIAVRGLKQEDFILLDNGKPQVIRFFSPVESDGSTSSPLSPDTYVNIPQRKGAPPSVTAVLFDVQNSDWTSQAYALHGVRDFLRGLHPEDHIGLYLLRENRVKVLHDFDQDSTELLKAIQWYDQQHRLPKPQQATTTGDAALDQLEDFLYGKESEFHVSMGSAQFAPIRPSPYSTRPAFRYEPAWGTFLRMHQESTSSVALEAIARHMSSAAGRKSLVWVTDNLPNELVAPKKDLQNEVSDSFQPQVEHHGFAAVMLGRNGLRDNPYSGIAAAGYDVVPALVRLFNDLNLSVYPVRAKGLNTYVPDNVLTFDLGFNNPNIGFWQGPPLEGGQLGSLTPLFPGPNVGGNVGDVSFYYDDTEQQMAELANRTGGRAFYSRNNLQAGIERALQDSSYSYELAYYPDHNNWNGKWHRIEIQAKRADVKVLARGGYFALPEPSPPGHDARKNLLLKVAESPMDAAELPLTVHVTTSGPPGPQLQAQVSFNPQAVLTSYNSGKWKGNFELLFFQLDNRNQVLEVPVENFDADLNQAEYQKYVQDGVRYAQKLSLKPGASILAVVLHDKNSGAVGSVRIPLAQYAAKLDAAPPR